MYYKLRKDEIAKAKYMLKRMKTEVILDIITKCCWRYSIQYEILIKNLEILEIKLKGSNETVLLKFHKSGMVFHEDYEKFLLAMDVHGVRRGIYITSGVFEGRILKQHKNVFSKKKVIIQDNFHFIKGQLGLKESAHNVFKLKKIDFFKYLP